MVGFVLRKETIMVTESEESTEEAKETKMEGKISRKQVFVQGIFLIAIVMIVMAMALSGVVEEGPAVGIIGVITGYALGSTITTVQQATAERERQRIRELEKKLEEAKEKLTPAWVMAQHRLDRYLEQNSRHIRQIFILSVIAMVIGFGMVILGIWEAIQSPDELVPAAISGVAGLITEFIGTTFLFLFRSTVQQARDYAPMLERMGSVGMVMHIVDTIPEPDLKSQTKAKVSVLLMQQMGEIPAETEGVGG